MNVVQRFSSSRALMVGAGLLVFGLGAAVVKMACTCKAAPVQIERWVLQADRDPACYYGSSWNDGDLFMPRATHNEPVRFIHQFPFEDGCTWRSTETLTPDGNGGYTYQYDEEPLSCAEGAHAAPACPLGGHVGVIPVMYE
jgi:hypothetical protein